MPIVLSSFQALTASVAITLTGGRKAVEFFPFSENETVSHTGTLNLWKGFAVKPAAIPDFKQYAVFRDHLLNNVCDGDEALFKWVWAFFANMVQRPRDRPGVALVLRGGRGVGKTIVGEVFGGLLHPANHLLVDDARYVTGNFNMHFSCCLLLQADEAVWAGDKAAEGRLKGLITAPTQMIETKGVEPIQLKNYVRLLMTSNEHWVVPAGEDERRFAVLDVNPRYSNDDVYFKKMKDELWGRGGLEHLLGDLLAFDLSTVNLRRIPQTKALLDQKIRSLSPLRKWWLGILNKGSVLGSEWVKAIPCEMLFRNYIKFSDTIGFSRKSDETIFGGELRKLIPGLQRDKRSVTWVDESGVILPSLEVLRDAFDGLVGQSIEWQQDEQASDDFSDDVEL